MVSPQPYRPAETFPRLNTDGSCSPTKPDPGLLTGVSPPGLTFLKTGYLWMFICPNGMFAFFTAASPIDSLIHSTPDLYL